MNRIKSCRAARLLAAAALFGFSIVATAATQPATMLEDVSDRMIDTLQQQRTELGKHPEKLFVLVEEALAPHVDTEAMARMVLAAHWRKASAAQRARFTEEFKTLLVRFYVSALLDDPNQLDRLLEKGDALITYQPAQLGERGDRARVRAEVHPPDGGPVAVTFSLFKKGETWKIYDVNVEGISVVINYRGSFGSQISRHGLDALIEDLAARNRELWEQTVNGKGDRSAP